MIDDLIKDTFKIEESDSSSSDESEDFQNKENSTKQ